jgi:hypothetical protein
MVFQVISSEFSHTMARFAVSASVALQAIQRVLLGAMSLASIAPRPAIAPMHVLFRSHFFEVLWVLARRIATKMISVVPLRRPASMRQQEGNAVCLHGTGRTISDRASADLSVASGIARSQPRPAFVWAALLDLRPVAFFERLRTRPHHGHSIAYWYE